MDFNARKILISSVIVSILIGFGGGVLFSKYTKSGSNLTFQEVINKELGKPASVDFSLFWQAWSTLQDKYVDKSKLDSKKMIYGAISGMVNSIGDPYTVFFEPTTSKKFKEEIAGAFGGVGMEIGKRNNILTVIAPIKDSPASQAGIRSGDRILKINDKLTTDLSVEEAVDLIRGPKGTVVTITVAPSDSDKTKEIRLTRDIIKIPAVSWKMVDDHVAYLAIYTFSENVDAEFKKAAQEILKSKADRLILDVRNDPGGLLDSAVNIAGWFLPNGSLVVSEDYGDGRKDEFRTQGDESLKSLPTVILMNGGSASASEILAGALHDNRSIKLIGEKSFGKGSVQQLQNFADASSLKVTIAKWLTPSGISISEKGLQPDVQSVVDEKNTASSSFEFATPGKDPQLDKAISTVKEQR